MQADTAVGPRGSQAAQGAIACKHLTSQYLAATAACPLGPHTGKTSSHAGLCGTQVAEAVRHVHCTKKRGIYCTVRYAVCS